MQNHFSPLFRSVLQSVRRIFRTQPEPTITPEQFREMFAQMMCDPENRRIILRSMIGTVFPIEGGAGCPSVTASSNTQNRLTKWSATGCDLADTIAPVFEDGSGNVGVGTINPGTTLHVSKASPAANEVIVEGTGSGAQQAGIDFKSNGTTVGTMGFLPPYEFRMGATIANTGYYTTLYAGGSEVMRLNNGNVGIGITNPAAKLHVAGVLRSTDPAAGGAGGAVVQGVVDADNDYARAVFSHNAYWDSSTNLWNAEAIGANDAAAILIPNNGGFQFIVHPSTGNTARTFTHAQFLAGTKLTLTSDGNVGIGTASPGSILDVHTASQGIDGLNLQNGPNVSLTFRPNSSVGANNGLVQAGDKSIIYSAGSINSGNLVIAPWSDVTGGCGIRMTNTGNVGIATPNPAEALEVNGNIKITLNSGYGIKFQDGSLQTTAACHGSGTANKVAKYTTSGVALGDSSISDDGTNVGVATLNQIVFLEPRGGSNDDTGQIQAAIDGLAATNGGLICLMPGIYNISSALNLNKNGIKIRGYGGCRNDLPVGGSEVPVTKLLWTSTGTGTILQLKPPPHSAGSNNDQIQDLEISDLTIDGAGVKGNPNVGANIGVLLDRVVSSKFRNIHVRNMRDDGTGIGLKLTTTADDTNPNDQNVDCEFNLFENCSVLFASKCVQIMSEAALNVTANSSHNVFIGLSLRYWGAFDSDTGIELGNCDNNKFDGTWIFNGGTTGYGVVVTDPFIARSNYFYQLGPASGLIVKTNLHHVLDTNGSKNFIFGYDRDNSEPAPTTGNPTTYPPEDFLAWTDSQGVTHGFPVLASELPNPSASTLGGVQSAAGVAHEWINSIDTSGVPHLSQPAASDVSGLAASATTDTTDAANISSGTMDAARLPDASASSSGKVNTSAQTFGGPKTFQDGVDGSGSSAGVMIRRFDQTTRPTLNDNEVAFWYRSSDGVFGLLFKDGPTGNYFWVAGSSGNPASAYANPS